MEVKQLVLPVTPLRDSPVFPNNETVLVFGRNRSLEALKSAWEKDKLIFVVMQKDGRKADPISPEDFFTVGTVCQVRHILQSEGEISVSVVGLYRAAVLAYQSMDQFIIASVVQITEITEDGEEINALAHHILSDFQSAVRMGKTFDFLSMMRLMSGLPPGQLADQIVPMMNLKPEQRQGYLEEPSIRKRLENIAQDLAKELKVLELEHKIATSAHAKLEKNARENILRSQKKAIEEELGESENGGKDLKELKDRATKAGMPDEVKKKFDKEVKRLEMMSPMNPEHGYVRTFLDWLLDMPWNIASPNNADILEAGKILNEDHYGLEKVKERIVEYLAVLKLKHENQKIEPDVQLEPAAPNLPPPVPKKKASTPTILCFVGPPGVGKTSIGKSIARALGRKFVRISLGGIRDEAEIRGHRRTYVGSMPGRIIQGIKQAGTNNPVFMLDEVDKIGNDFRGDPSAALLEALDPEQNNAFSDHYLEVPFDLSEVIFITTANILETIPPALQDRLEVIHFPGYTGEEKFHIGKKYLIAKQIESNGLSNNQAFISNPALKTIISRYTREAGVRNLEREIATIFRKIARKIAEGKAKGKAIITPNSLHRYLGPYKFTSTIAERKDEIGLATGLFWSQAGGGILFIEVAIMPGKGSLTLTGHLGEVMQESCKAALSYVRSRWKMLGLEEKFFQKIDVHVHVPEGGMPKDGPSAGIAITTALASALTKIPVKKTVGMTGEVTLRGRVMEIGGVKEKVIGAHLGGLKTIILPKDNKKDLEDIPKYILKDLDFKFVDSMDEVLKLALDRPNFN